jgi:UDP-3-O-[3-hydroxymyristoyl] glucosamine N-acyltransferase
MHEFTLLALANRLNATLIGDANVVVTSIATLKSAQSGQISFLSNSKYKEQIVDSKASAIIMRASDAIDYKGNALILDEPYVGYAMLANIMDTTPRCAFGISPNATISPDATIGDNVSVGANTVIEAGVVIGANSRIGPNSFIGENTILGESCILWAGVVIYHGVTIGTHCLIHSTAVIGADGFGFAPHNNQWHKIPQLGGVTIGCHTEIGAGSTIDRGALDNTVIGKGCIIDNQVHIGHNAIFGEHCAIAANSCVAGSTVIGNQCIIGGACAISGHLTICDGVTITGMSMVIKNITEAGVYSSGMPSQSNREWRKNGARYRQLDDMAKRLKAVEKRLKND